MNCAVCVHFYASYFMSSQNMYKSQFDVEKQFFIVSSTSQLSPFKRTRMDFIYTYRWHLKLPFCFKPHKELTIKVCVLSTLLYYLTRFTYRRTTNSTLPESCADAILGYLINILSVKRQSTIYTLYIVCFRENRSGSTTKTTPHGCRSIHIGDRFSTSDYMRFLHLMFLLVYESKNIWVLVRNIYLQYSHFITQITLCFYLDIMSNV